MYRMNLYQRRTLKQVCCWDNKNYEEDKVIDKESDEILSDKNISLLLSPVNSDLPLKFDEHPDEDDCLCTTKE